MVDLSKTFLLNRAILEGYGNRLMVGRFLLLFYRLKLTQLADVNVHPTKQEVRLSKERELMALISKAIDEALSEGVLIPEALENLQGRAKERRVFSVQTDFLCKIILYIMIMFAKIFMSEKRAF